MNNKVLQNPTDADPFLCRWIFYPRKKVYPINRKQKRFCDEYLIDLNATQAAIRAGYNPKYAHTNAAKLLQNTTIKTYLDAKLAEIQSEKTAQAQEVMEYLTAVMRGEHTEQTLRLVGDGMQEITNIDVPAKDRIKAAELLGKRYGLFKDNLQMDGDLSLTIQIDYGEDDTS